jgi:GTPase SAR1 family protein
MGGGGVGKTSLVRRLLDDTFDHANTDTTVEETYTRLFVLNGRRVLLKLVRAYAHLCTFCAYYAGGHGRHVRISCHAATAYGTC